MFEEIPRELASIDELLTMLHKETHDKVREMLAPPAVKGMVVFECVDVRSSCLGDRKALIYGPGCTYKYAYEVMWQDADEEVPNRLDTELASTSQKQPVAWYEKPYEPAPVSAETSAQ